MGAVNYFTSDYITMGYRRADIGDFDSDKSEILEEMISNGFDADDISEDDYSEYVSQLIGDYEIEDFLEIEAELKKHSFCYYHVCLKHGYYDGFTVDIEFNYKVAFDGWEDKPEAQKEITEIKQFLLTCANMGLRACAPWWATTFYSYEETVAMISAAVKEMRQEVRNTPTWRQYEKAGF